MRRRTFVLGALATTAGAATGGALVARGNPPRDGSESRVYGSTRVRRRRPASDAPNVLLISIDDCNDWLGFLNDHPGTHTPNLDALAATSLSFDKAYCTAPMCLPARTSVLFGRHALDTGVYDHTDPSLARYDELASATPSLVDDLWAAGYDVYGAGKVFHDEQEARWTEYRRFPWYVSATPRADPNRFDPGWISPHSGQPIGSGDDLDYTMLDFGPSGRSAAEEADGQATAWILDRLARDHRRPFLLALGLYLPHEPWRMPQEFFDLHPLEDVVVPEVRPDDLGDLPSYPRDHVVDRNHRFERLRESGLWEQAVQAYQAALSYADHHVGQVLDALRSSRYADDTVVTIWSDHGYHLGEKMHIEKFTLWERATRVPFLLHVPDRFDTRQVFEPPVSALDIGPTLAELCGAEIHADHAGQSLLDLVDRPERADDRPAITTWQQGNHSVRRGHWRYIRYRTGESELYDQRRDPQEFTNLAGDRSYAAIVDELDGLLPPPMRP